MKRFYAFCVFCVLFCNLRESKKEIFSFFGATKTQNFVLKQNAENGARALFTYNL